MSKKKRKKKMIRKKMMKQNRQSQTKEINIYQNQMTQWLEEDIGLKKTLKKKMIKFKNLEYLNLMLIKSRKIQN